MVNKYQYIINSLNLISLPYDLQNQAFDKYDFADVSDEVISSFENAFLYLPEVIDAGYFSLKNVANIIRIYNKFSWCMRNVGIDNFTDREWNKVRYMAKDLLDDMGLYNNDVNIDF